MPAILSSEALNLLILADDLSGCDVGFYYRNPTPEETIAYNNATIQRKGTKVFFRTAEAQEKYGKKIIKGIRDGDFAVPGPDDKPRLISSDETSKDYEPAWMTLIWKYKPYLILTFAGKIFGTPAEALDEMEDTLEPGDDEDKEEGEGEDAEKN